MTQDTNERLARLEERMETVKAELGRELAEFRADMANRETRITKDIRGEFRAGLMVAVAVIGLMVALAAFIVG